jgi:hypothetical protein
MKHYNTLTKHAASRVLDRTTFNPSTNTQNYWVLGLCPSSYILEELEKMFQKLDLLLSSGLNRVGVFSLPPKDVALSSFLQQWFSTSVRLQSSKFFIL